MEQVGVDVNINTVKTLRPGNERKEDTIASQKVSVFECRIREIKDNVKFAMIYLGGETWRINWTTNSK